ncbi:hypothetical protein BOTBODRAFT_39741 [Botryobasidium botryosum FD-172 SS1]|uniref:Uncharacterized protein n=1 Tax=Botryobasidium botryosum (strain FD-172 SS1) TaxID=930990 RepID=A0A067LT13_BOTB1|nr:hypothetical protein BOTBODRAFT_39741 [Botryobasidium botryosum FD-172 SS1]
MDVSSVVNESQYVPCVPNILIGFNYAATKIPALAVPDMFQSAVVRIAFTRHNQPDSHLRDVLYETLPIPLLRDTHMMGSIRRTLRRKFSPGFRGGLLGTSQNFTVAETTILGPNPYNFFQRTNNTASLLLFQGVDTTELRTISDIQDPSPWTALSNIGGMLSIGGVILSTLFGLGYAALLGLEDFSLFPSSQKSTQAGEDEESEKRHTEAVATGSDDGGVGGGEVHRRNGRDTENIVPPPPLNRYQTV